MEAKKELRNKIISIMVTEEEKSKIKEYAKENNLDVSNYMRFKALKK